MAAQPSYQPDRRNEQWQSQEHGRSQGGYNQEYQRFNEYPKSQNGYNTGHPPDQYQPQEQWQGRSQIQYSQTAPQQNYSNFPDGYHSDSGHGQYDQGPAANRNHQYDERYRSNNGQGRPPMQQNGSSQSNDNRHPPRSQRSENSTPKHRPKRKCLTPMPNPARTANTPKHAKEYCVSQALQKHLHGTTHLALSLRSRNQASKTSIQV